MSDNEKTKALVKLIENMSDDQINELSSILDSIKNDPSPKKKNKKRRGKRKKQAPDEESRLISKPPESTPESTPKEPTSGQRRTRKRGSDLKDFDLTKHRENRSRGKGSGRSSTPARTEPVNTSTVRENLFFKQGWNNTVNDDREADQRLSGNNQVSRRGLRQSIVEAECQKCGDFYEISSKLAVNDGEGYKFTCDRCIMSSVGN